MPKKAEPAKKAPAKKEIEFSKYEDKGISEDEIKDIKEAFDLFDKDGSGEIDTEELKTALESLGIDAKNATLQSMMDSIDENKSGEIDFDEFVEMMTAKVTDKEKREDYDRVFQLFIGDDDSDYIELKHLTRVAKDLNEQMTEQELMDMITRADTDKDGKVSSDEFYAIMTTKI